MITVTLDAQTLRGRVVQAGSNTPIVAAYVSHLSSDSHTHTDETGRFQFVGVTTGDTIQVSYLGYGNLTVVISDLNDELRLALEETSFDLSEILVRPGVNAMKIISEIDLKVRPISSAQDVLQLVPGLFIGQHAGGGKAEQIFLRGFDIDHGTDISISVEGMPVNMVSHAHGQGYADMHFIIPEAIQNIDFGKGTYYANRGNFTTAGYVDFQLKDRVDKTTIVSQIGQFNSIRTAALINLVNNERQSFYVGSAFTSTDGPFESSQDFSRLNLLAKFTTSIGKYDELSIWASHFQSKWDASGQIPQRAVDREIIGRFGAIDDTEGGFTDRTNVVVNHNHVINDKEFVKSNVSFSDYGFELFSNFTFFLEDPENGDQIRQFERRQIFNMNTEWNHILQLPTGEGLLQVGTGLRYDNIDDNELSRTLNRRQTLEQLQFGDVDEANVWGYVNAEFELGDWTINPGLRVDHFTFNYVDQLARRYDRESQSRVFAGPKMNILYNVSPGHQIFLKSGVGYHSNDSRVVIDRQAEKILPAAFGLDLGSIFQPAPRLLVNAALWYLALEQEFVYVGDAGIVEPSGRSRRVGFDLGANLQLNDWLFADIDVNYALARSVNDPEGMDNIPLAPIWTSSGGLDVKSKKIVGGLRYRYIADRPANEDNSIVADGYFVVDASFNYQIVDRVSLGFDVRNLLDTEWNETQFATLSRLQNEMTPVEEIHFTPGTPRYIQGVLRFTF